MVASINNLLLTQQLIGITIHEVKPTVTQTQHPESIAKERAANNIRQGCRSPPLNKY